MKIEEVVKELNNIRDGFREWSGLNARGEEVFRIAIEALEKQMPSGIRFNGDEAVCPKCGADAEWKRYCDECGQRLVRDDEN